MDRIKIKDREKLINFLTIVTWLDRGRWERIEERIADDFGKIILRDKNLKPKERILLHWLVYITDRGKPAQTVWNSNTKLIRDHLVNPYMENKVQEKEEINEIFDEFL